MITLTNGVQVPENVVQLRTTAPMDGYYVAQPLQLVQYDETLPVAAVQLTYQNQPYTPPTGAELNVRMGKPDGTTVYNPCLGMDSSGIVYFVFTQQMTIVAGTGTLTVEITDSGVKNSAPIIAEIRPNPVPEGSIESTDEFLTLQEILQQAEQWGQIVQDNASNIQQVVDNLEDIQNAAENAQAAAASAAAAQQAAQEALGFRTFFSAVTPDANGNLDPSRPMTVGPAASVEIESAGDRIQSVTALGFTQQAGTGDPSPTNVRALTNGGLKLVKLVLTGAESWAVSGTTYPRFYLTLAKSAPTNWTNTIACTIFKPNNILNEENKPGIGAYGTTLYLRESKYNGSVEALKADLSAKYAAGDPVIVWYIPASESDATGLYAPIILEGGEYRATCLPLTAPLCEGDSVVSWVRSGCDVEVMIDGTENFLVDPASTFADVIRFSIQLSDADTSSPVVFSERFTPSTVFTLNSEYIGITDIGKLIGAVYKSRLSSQDAEGVKAYFAAHPLTVWYRSTNYTEADDIAVSLETHVQAVLVPASGMGQTGGSTLYFKLSNLKPSTYPKCSHVPSKSPYSEPSGVYCGADGITLTFKIDGFTSMGEYNEYFAEQATAGTPVTIVYQLATPITYAHPAVAASSTTGDQLTYTVTGQSGGTVSVSLKPFQDGGHAATADNATQLDGLTLAALQNLLVPVGYIFSWAPVDDGPDLSTPAKVAAYFGFGTWQAYGTGRVLVGVDSGQTEFATVGQTGGEKTHTLSEQELPSVSPGVKYGNSKPIALDSGDTDGYKLSFTSENVAPNNIVAPFGGNQPHNNLQPYITVYRWQRVA